MWTNTRYNGVVNCQLFHKHQFFSPHSRMCLTFFFCGLPPLKTKQNREWSNCNGTHKNKKVKNRLPWRSLLISLPVVSVLVFYCLLGCIIWGSAWVCSVYLFSSAWSMTCMHNIHDLLHPWMLKSLKRSGAWSFSTSARTYQTNLGLLDKLEHFWLCVFPWFCVLTWTAHCEMTQWNYEVFNTERKFWRHCSKECRFLEDAFILFFLNSQEENIFTKTSNCQGLC